MSVRDEIYMKRCFDLAALGEREARPNPPVGAVLVNDDVIIGEGFHWEYGGPHAEVNALSSVSEEKKHLIKESTLYVSLEPCNYHGKTPACTDFIIRHGIKKLVVSTEDPNPKVSGAALNHLRNHGVKVIPDVLGAEGKELIRIFRKNILRSKPWIILKFTQSRDGFIGKAGEKTKLSNSHSDIFVHSLRSYTDGIMAGTNTIITDNPELTTRHIDGPHPKRIVLDRNLLIPDSYRVFNDNSAVMVINEKQDSAFSNRIYKRFDFSSRTFISDMMKYLFQSGIYVLLVEGGAKLISSFNPAGEWDEAIIIDTPFIIRDGVKSPVIAGKLRRKMQMGSDSVSFVRHVE